MAFGTFCQVLKNLNVDWGNGKVLFCQNLFWCGEKSWENMHQVAKFYSKLTPYTHVNPHSEFGGLVTLTALFLSLEIPPSFNFPLHFTSFFAYVALVPPSAGMSVVCVYTGVLKFQATSSLALQAQLAS